MLDGEERRELLEILEDRYQRRSTVVTSQLPVSQWHKAINDPTFPGAILDRLIHNAYRIDLQGDSMRKRLAETVGDWSGTSAIKASPTPNRYGTNSMSLIDWKTCST